MRPSAGNRCGHDPKRPKLHPKEPIERDGAVRRPKILARAAREAKAWYKHPRKCPPLEKGERRVRSERREAIQIVIETILSLMDLSSMCLGSPTLDNGFIDVDMQAIVDKSGLSKRRCERAIAELIRAKFFSATRRSGQNEQGDYFGLRSIRRVQVLFFEWLRLDKYLAIQRIKATRRQEERAAKAGKKLQDLYARAGRKIKRVAKKAGEFTQKQKETWLRAAGKFMVQHPDASTEELYRLTSEALGYNIYAPEPERRS